MKNIRLLYFIIFSLQLMYSCIGDEKQRISSINYTEKISLDNEIEKELLALSEEIFSLLKESDFKEISERVDPEKELHLLFMLTLAI